MDDERLTEAMRRYELTGRVEQLEDAVGFMSVLMAVACFALALWLLRSAPWKEVFGG